MNYNQVLQYIVQWVKENHNNEITGDILQSVLIEMLQYTRDQDDSLESVIEDLQSQIDNISISQTLNVFLGVDDPNITPPTETYQAPDIYVKTDTDDLYIYSGSEWLQLTNLPEVNTFISELRIDDLGSIAKSNVVDYINNLTPPYNKVGNENLIISLYEGGDLVQVYWLINNGKGLYGSGQNQISESDLVSFDSNGDMQKSTYDPTNVNGDAFDFGNMHNVPDFLEEIPTLQQVTEQGATTDKYLQITDFRSGNRVFASEAYEGRQVLITTNFKAETGETARIELHIRGAFGDATRNNGAFGEKDRELIDIRIKVVKTPDNPYLHLQAVSFCAVETLQVFTNSDGYIGVRLSLGVGFYDPRISVDAIMKKGNEKGKITLSNGNILPPGATDVTQIPVDILGLDYLTAMRMKTTVYANVTANVDWYELTKPTLRGRLMTGGAGYWYGLNAGDNSRGYNTYFKNIDKRIHSFGYLAINPTTAFNSYLLAFDEIGQIFTRNIYQNTGSIWTRFWSEANLKFGGGLKLDGDTVKIETFETTILLQEGNAEEAVYPVFSNFREDITITSMILVSRNQVTGQALIANLLINDTVATGTGLTIPTGGRTSNEITAGININKGDNIDLNVTQLGSIDTGNNLQLYIKYKKR